MSNRTEYPVRDTQVVVEPDAAGVIDAPITRAELIDIIMNEIEGELEAKRDSLYASRAAVPDIVAGELLAMFVANNDPTVKVAEATRMKGHTYIKLSVIVKDADLPASVKNKLATTAEFTEEIHAVNSEIGKLRSGRHRARLALIRKSLEASTKGKKVLDLVDSFKGSIKRTLLKA